MKFFLPPVALQQHIAILGKTGSGKTNTGKVIVEHGFDERERICILDPIKSDWWGLTLSADGKKAGLPFYILGGPYGHLPLHAHSGKAIGALVASGELRYCILDMAEFPPGGRTRFFADFAPVLMQKQKGVLRLVLEEAHEFAPKERVGFEKENYAIHYAKEMATAGRKKGLRLMVLTQRTQALHNALLGSCDTMIAQRMTAPADMEPIQRWLKANVKDKAERAEIEGSLSNIATGDGWLISGEAQIRKVVQFPLARTFDNNKTPETGDDGPVIKTVPVDLDALRGILGKAADEALANDPAALRKQIAALTADLANLRESKLVPVKPFGGKELDIARRAGWREGFEAGAIELAQHMAEKALARTQQVVDHIRAVCDKELEATARTFASHKVHVPRKGASLPDAHPRHDSANRQANGVQKTVVSQDPRFIDRSLRESAETAVASLGLGAALAKREGELTGLGGKILAALLWLEQKGMSAAPRPTVAAIAKVKVTGGYVRNTFSALKTGGYIDFPTHGMVAITDAGRAAAPPLPDVGSDVKEAWLEMLRGLEKEIVQVLVDLHPEQPSRIELGSRLSKTPSGGYFRNVMGRLSTMGAIYYPSPGTVALTKYVIPQ